VLDRVLAFGDAWFPNYDRGGGDISERAAELRGRADRHIDVIPIGVPADPGQLERLAGAGCRRAIHWLPSGGLGAVVPALERWESAIAQFTGEA
jgi:hypothetical protein